MDADTPGRIRQLQRVLVPEYIPSDEPMMVLPRSDPFNPTPEWMKPLERDLQDTFDNPLNLPEKWHHKEHAPQPKFPVPREPPAPEGPLGDPFNTPMWHAGLPAPQARRS